MSDIKCECGGVVFSHNANRGITECHECQAKSAHNNELAKEFLEQLFETDGVDEWMERLKQDPEVLAWAKKQFKVDEVKDGENQNEVSR